jgi:predicted site-specific integrase-resolvase
MNGIGLREASRTYGVPITTLHNWVEQGLIRLLQKPGKRGQASLLFEPDVAQLAASYKPGRGRWNRPSLEQIV